MTGWFGSIGDCGCCICECVFDPEVQSRKFFNTPTLKVEIANAPASFSYRGIRTIGFVPGYFVDEYTVEIDMNGTYFLALPKRGICINGDMNVGAGEAKVGTWKLTRVTGTVPFFPTTAQCNSPDPWSTTVTDFDVNVDVTYTTNPVAPDKGWYRVVVSRKSGSAARISMMDGNTRCADNYAFDKTGTLPTNPPTDNNYTGKLQYVDLVWIGGSICGVTQNFQLDVADCTLTIEDI